MLESISTIQNPAIKLYALIGYCVSTAAEIEHEMFECYRIASECPPAEAARVFFKAPSQEHRLKVADEALSECLADKNLAAEWTRLRGHLAEQLGPEAARNLIAHNPAGGGVYISYPADTLAEIGKGKATLHVKVDVSQHYGLVALGRRKKQVETIESLSDYAELLTHLQAQLFDFRMSLKKLDPRKKR